MAFESREKGLGPGALPQRRDFYYGTLTALTPRATLGPQSSADRAADAHLDAARPIPAGRRSAAVTAAGSVRDATVIAILRSGQPDTIAPAAIRVYKVQLEPFHAGPLALVEELCRRMQAGAPVEPLIREYWEPTGIWHLTEVLALSLTVVEEVPPASEREVYVPRWVLYQRDCDRAQLL